MTKALIFQVSREEITHDIVINPSAIVAFEYCDEIIRVYLNGGQVATIDYSIKNYEMLKQAIESLDGHIDM